VLDFIKARVIGKVASRKVAGYTKVASYVYNTVIQTLFIRYSLCSLIARIFASIGMLYY
jgi:hypothetical protein